ncbi:PIN domain-containing protein [Candidatus Saccharibacteria bacterium]|nr:PIN domain-containing protein [Candidatus Saccharibacteria bacterium]
MSNSKQSNSNIISLDTSILIRIITRGPYEQALAALNFLIKNDVIFHVSTLAISEAVYVLDTQYHYSRMQIIDGLNFFLTRFSDSAIYERYITERAFPFYLEHPKLSFNDCCLAAYAEVNHAEPLFTFDKKLANQSPSAKLLEAT